MPVQLRHDTDRKYLEVRLSGKLETDDYKTFAPEIERLIYEHGKLRILVVLEDFHGWSAGALWEDIKFDAKHFSDVEKVAIVGDKAWQKGMSVFCKPFTTARVRHFEHGEIETARHWLTHEADVDETHGVASEAARTPS